MSASDSFCFFCFIRTYFMYKYITPVFLLSVQRSTLSGDKSCEEVDPWESTCFWGWELEHLNKQEHQSTATPTWLITIVAVAQKEKKKTSFLILLSTRNAGSCRGGEVGRRLSDLYYSVLLEAAECFCCCYWYCGRYDFLTLHVSYDNPYCPPNWWTMTAVNDLWPNSYFSVSTWLQ